MIGWEKTEDPEEICLECRRMEEFPGQFPMCPGCGAVVCRECKSKHRCAEKPVIAESKPAG